jgi:hypothetical protein
LIPALEWKTDISVFGTSSFQISRAQRGKELLQPGSQSPKNQKPKGIMRNSAGHGTGTHFGISEFDFSVIPKIRSGEQCVANLEVMKRDMNL